MTFEMQKTPTLYQRQLLFEKRTIAELSETEMTEINGGSLPAVAIATIGVIFLLPPVIDAIKDRVK